MTSQFQVKGEKAFLSQINQFGQAARKDGRVNWVVGTVVGYGQHHEFGTRRMRARPHWRPAIFQLSQGIPDDGRSLPGVRRRRSSDIKIRGPFGGRREWELWFGPEKSAPGRLAALLKREVKRQIKAKRVFKTGNYHGSIAHGKTEAQMIQRSRAMVKPGMGATAIV